MKNLKMELTAGGKIFAEVKIQSGILLWDELSPSLFIMAMTLLNQRLRNCKYTESQEKTSNYLQKKKKKKKKEMNSRLWYK